MCCNVNRQWKLALRFKFAFSHGANKMGKGTNLLNLLTISVSGNTLSVSIHLEKKTTLYTRQNECYHQNLSIHIIPMMGIMHWSMFIIIIIVIIIIIIIIIIP